MRGPRTGRPLQPRGQGFEPVGLLAVDVQQFAAGRQNGQGRRTSHQTVHQCRNGVDGHSNGEDHRDECLRDKIHRFEMERDESEVCDAGRQEAGVEVVRRRLRREVGRVPGPNVLTL